MISRMRKSMNKPGAASPPTTPEEEIPRQRRSRSVGASLGRKSGSMFGGKSEKEREKERDAAVEANGQRRSKSRGRKQSHAEIPSHVAAAQSPLDEVRHGDLEVAVGPSQPPPVVSPAISANGQGPQLQRSKKAVASTPETLMTFEKNRSTLKKLRTSSRQVESIHGTSVSLPSLTIEQVMQLSVNPPGKASELHHMINGRQWAAVRIKLKLMKGHSNHSHNTNRKLTSAGVVASTTNVGSSSDIKPIKSSSSMMKALLQRDEMGRTPLHLILQRRSVGSSVMGTLSLKKAPPDIIVGILHACPRASSIPDVENNYPLHVAVLNGHRIDIVRLLVHCYPGAVLEQNINSDTPLILAANFSIALKLTNPSSQPQPATEDSEDLQQIITPHDSPRAITASSQCAELNDKEAKIAFATSPRWELVSLFLQHHQESAQLRNRHDMSVLEMALQRHAPAIVIRTLLRADRTAASIQRRINLGSKSHSSSSSHNADEGDDAERLENAEFTEPPDYSGANVIRPDNVNIGIGVMTPLSLAIMRNASVEVLGLVALSFPSAIHVRDECGIGPIAKCWLEWYYESSPHGKQSNLGIVRKEGPLMMLARLLQTGGAVLHPELANLWRKLQTLLCIAQHPESVKNRDFIEERATFESLLPDTDESKEGDQSYLSRSTSLGSNGAAPGERSPFTKLSPEEDIHNLPIIPPYPYVFRPVHAAASQDCPLEILNIAMLLHPNQYKVRNENGSTPLHLAAAATLYVKQCYEPHLVPPLERLVRAAPETASMTDCFGRLPLHIAIINGKKWDEGVSALITAEPRALNSPDPSNDGLYPACLAACQKGTASANNPILGYIARNRVDATKWANMNNREQEQEIARVRHMDDLKGLSTLYNLLRAFPLVVSKELREQKASISCLALSDGVPLRTPAIELNGSFAQSSDASGGDSDSDDDSAADPEVYQGVADWGVDDAANILLFKDGLAKSNKTVKTRNGKKKRKNKKTRDSVERNQELTIEQDAHSPPSDLEKKKRSKVFVAGSWEFLGKSDRVDAKADEKEVPQANPPEMLVESVQNLHAIEKEKMTKMGRRRKLSIGPEAEIAVGATNDEKLLYKTEAEDISDTADRVSNDNFKKKISKQMSGIFYKGKQGSDSTEEISGNNRGPVFDSSEEKTNYENFLMSQNHQQDNDPNFDPAALPRDVINSKLGSNKPIKKFTRQVSGIFSMSKTKPGGDSGEEPVGADNEEIFDIGGESANYAVLLQAETNKTEQESKAEELNYSFGSDNPNARRTSGTLKKKLSQQVTGKMFRSKSKQGLDLADLSGSDFGYEHISKANYDSKVEAREIQKLDPTLGPCTSLAVLDPDKSQMFRTGSLESATASQNQAGYPHDQNSWIFNATPNDNSSDSEKATLTRTRSASCSLTFDSHTEEALKRPVLGIMNWDLRAKTIAKDQVKYSTLPADNDAEPTLVDEGVPNWNYIEVETNRLMAKKEKANKKIDNHQEKPLKETATTKFQKRSSEKPNNNMVAEPNLYSDGDEIISPYLNETDKTVFKGEPSWNPSLAETRRVDHTNTFSDTIVGNGDKQNQSRPIKTVADQCESQDNEKALKLDMPLASTTRKVKELPANYKKGEEALYRDSRGNISKVKVLKVHFDDELVPFYDILFVNGKEKQTDDGHLTKLDEGIIKATKCMDPKLRDPMNILVGNGLEDVMNETSYGRNVNPFAKTEKKLINKEVDLDGNPFDLFCEAAPAVQPLDLFGDYEESTDDENPFNNITSTVPGTPFSSSQGAVSKLSTPATYENDDLFQNMVCVLCNESKRQTLLLPCRHLCLCSACGTLAKVCPICGQRVQTILDVIL